MFVISSVIAKGNFLLLITPLDVFSLSCGYALHLAVWKIFIMRMFSACSSCSPRQASFHSLVIFTFCGVALVNNTFSIRKGRIRLGRPPSKIQCQ